MLIKRAKRQKKKLNAKKNKQNKPKQAKPPKDEEASKEDSDSSENESEKDEEDKTEPTKKKSKVDNWKKLQFKSDYYSVFFIQFIIPLFKMGAIFGKSIPMHKVTTEMLRSHKTCSFSKNQLLTPRMCSLVLKKTSDRTLKCREREVTALKDFLDSQHNFVDKVTFPLPRYGP